MKKLLLILFGITILTDSYGQLFTPNQIDSIDEKMDYVFSQKEYFISLKEKEINNLKKILPSRDIAPEAQYDVYIKLVNLYEKLDLDSAMHYAKESLEVANKLNKTEWVTLSNLLLARHYSSAGMYVESKTILDKVNSNTLAENLRRQYYFAQSEYYSHYAQSNSQHIYFSKNEEYRDSLLNYLNSEDLTYQVLNAENLFFSGEEEKAEQVLLKLLSTTSDEQIERAVIAYTLGLVYRKKGDSELERIFLQISAICDIVNGIRDNASLQSLATYYSKHGDIKKAYKFMEAAINDIVKCNVRFRTIESASSFSSIYYTYLHKVTAQEKKLRISLLAISFLSLFLIAISIYVLSQKNRISKIKAQLANANENLKQLIKDLNSINKDLNTRNEDLKDANLIKEEYIAHFFDLCSEYIDKMEEYRKHLNSLAKNKKFVQLYQELDSNSNIEDELDKLHERFDQIFLSLYPNFIENFNDLLKPEEKIKLKSGEILNTELRIFALIRLGITDSIKIAGFLRYSLSTIYNYRTKTRNKAAVPRDEFEDYVAKIGSKPLKY